MDESKSIVVACALDGRYALPLAVMLQSAAANLRPQYWLEVYAVDDGVVEDDKRRVAASLSERVTLHWVTPRPPALPALFTWGRMPLTTYQKLTLGEWLPTDASKAIWLDCDLLVLDDLARLWEEPFAGHLALAVQDDRVPFVSSSFGIATYRELGLPADTRYFNAGVLVIDLRRWREERVTERATTYLGREGERVFFHDQEGLNAVLAGAWGTLDRRWNSNPTLATLFADRGNEPGREAHTVPWVVHFSGNLKPWNYYSTSHCHTLYYRYLDETAWAGWRPPRSWLGIAIAYYEVSRLRRWLYPIEQWTTRLVRAVTGRSERSRCVSSGHARRR